MFDIITDKGLIVLLVFVFFFVCERLYPVVLGVKDPVKREIKNVSFFGLSGALSALIVLPISALATGFHLWERAGFLAGGWGIIADLVVLDLFLFWWHRAVHEIPFLWRFHEVHHLDEHLDTTSAIRFHFGEVFFASCVRAGVLMVFAIPFFSVLVFEVVVFIATVFHHSNLKLHVGFERVVSKVFVTPSLHWVHHHAIRRDTDSNYGTVFSFWDRIFGTKSATERFEGMPIGVERMRDKGFWNLLVRPFRGLFLVVLFLVMVVPYVAAQDIDVGRVENGVRYVSPAQAADILAADGEVDIVVLDVRTPREFKRGHIEGAVNYNYFSFDFREKLGTLDPNKTYLVHCAAGHRSQWSLDAMREAGATKIIHMDDGLNAWREQDLPLVR